jgi:hypothetical protein
MEDLVMAFWRSATNGQVPDGAIACGKEANGTILYVARAGYQGGVHPGKVRPEFDAANISYDGNEVKVNPYEVLIGKGKWVTATNGEIPDGAIICGKEADGTPLYVARASYQGGVHPGKVRKEFGAANISYGGNEVKVNPYEVLVAE